MSLSQRTGEGASGAGASVVLLFDFPAFDVALGLIFVFLILSLVCSAIMETLSSVFAWRADYLRKGLRSLLDEELMNEVFSHPLVDPLIRSKRDLSPRMNKVPGLRRVVGWSRRERYPSYLPSRTVVSALLSLDVEARTKQAAVSADDALERMEKAVETIPVDRVREALTALLAEADGRAEDAAKKIEIFRASAENWYDDTMERVSGWYRRRVQLVLWLVAIAVTVVLNVDALNIGRTLWTDDAVRAAVVLQAEQAVREDDPEAAQNVEDLAIPLGWTLDEGGSQDVPSGWGWFGKLLGILFTAAAVSLGAPFWFDLLGKVAQLRSSGASPPPAAAAESGS